MLTGNELEGLMASLLISGDAPTGPTCLSRWLTDNAGSLGTRYASELDRHYFLLTQNALLAVRLLRKKSDIVRCTNPPRGVRSPLTWAPRSATTTGKSYTDADLVTALANLAFDGLFHYRCSL